MRLDDAEKASNAESGAGTAEYLQAELEGLGEIRLRLSRQLAEANVDAAEYEVQAPAQDDSKRVRARLDALRKELDGTQRAMDYEQAALAQHRTKSYCLAPIDVRRARGVRYGAGAAK